MPADTSGLAMTSSINSASLEDVRRPCQFSLHHGARQRQPIVLLQAELGRRDQPLGDRQQPGLAIAVPAAIDGNGFQAEIEGGKMRRGGQAGLA